MEDQTFHLVYHTSMTRADVMDMTRGEREGQIKRLIKQLELEAEAYKKGASQKQTGKVPDVV